jgi:hypothetical protein
VFLNRSTYSQPAIRQCNWGDFATLFLLRFGLLGLVAFLIGICAQLNAVQASHWHCGGVPHPQSPTTLLERQQQPFETRLQINTVDDLVAPSLPNQKFRLSNITFVPEIEDAALGWLNAASASKVVVRPTKNGADYLGRVPAGISIASEPGVIWQEQLLQRGLAMFLPENDQDLAAYALAEDTAIKAGAGMWGDENTGVLYLYDANSKKAPRHGRDVKDAIGQFAIVDGVVISVEHQEWRSYLNFGENWRTDFTIALDNETRTAFGTEDEFQSKLTALIGKKIRVRGVIENRGGPYIGLQKANWMCVEGQ